jgi:hypothetical protein
VYRSDGLMKKSIAAKYFFLVLLSFLHSFYVMGQEKNDQWLEQLLRKKASPFLLAILDQPGTYRYQLIYTKITRNKEGKPSFKNFHLQVNRENYFYPASVVKMPVAFLALQKLNELNKEGVTKHTPMLIDSSYEKQTKCWEDSSSANGLPSIAHYIRKAFLVSDNDAYNRLYEFLGQQYLNEKLWQKGYKDIRIIRRFVPMTEEQNRHTNAIRFVNNGQLVYEQPGAYNKIAFDFNKKVLIGKAHMDQNDSLINSPMDFTRHNNFPLAEMQQVLQSVLFPGSVARKKRFHFSETDRRFLLQAMSELPSESRHPVYDTSEFFDSYVKFFLFPGKGSKIPEHIRIFNKTGWAYGSLTDVAYIVDFKKNVEFMLAATIYVNKDEILNDDKYEYEETGYPFFKEVGNIIYQYELNRKRKYKPDLSAVKFTNGQ